jgi:arginyl-tRNA synthetase
MNELRIDTILTEKTQEAIKKVYEQIISSNQITLQKTRPEFEGDLTLLVFPLTKASQKAPEETAAAIGNYLKENVTEVTAFNVVKGFLNLVIADSYWANYLLTLDASHFVPPASSIQETVMVEFSSPNTNKPLHLGHIRNNLLGASVTEILKAAGKKVIRVNLVNDRGIHICKSMLAWKKWGNGETPESSGMKGDHLVGKYYVKYDQELKKERAAHPVTLPHSVPLSEGKEPGHPVGELEAAVQEMLRKWEAGDPETIALWKKMNGWVYDGFAKTYQALGIEFEKTYYESQTYLLGKKIVEGGLEKGVFSRREDGSVWVDLTQDGLDEKLLLRSDGTSVYITQDLGTIIQRANEFHFDKHIYVVGNEQDYHFKVLFLILKKLGYDWADKLFHLSYGMVDLPSGKMKSREGTVVDADELMEDMIGTARETTKTLGKTEGLNEAEAETLYHTIGLGALKYFILKVDPKKRMLFDPKESIDFNGNTGPFIQYTYARIKSVIRKADQDELPTSDHQPPAILQKKEKEVIKLLHGFSDAIQEAANSYNPGHLANYVYHLAKEYNQFYHEVPILKSENGQEKKFRLLLSEKTAWVIKRSLKMLGLNTSERM